MKNWKILKKELLKNKKVATEYKKLEGKYLLLSQLIEARTKRGITQKQLAKKIGTKQSAIARLESGNWNPTFSLLEKIASALGAKLAIELT